ncbi:MAG: SPOR domain-containing protein [Deltaproteobacteria bacterium]|nr:SPOR domain-containing protein [Deltaproteobacteria bacterium]
MKEKKEKAEKEKKSFRLELSRTALFFWSLGFLVLLGWIFTLGILAGRGLLPSGAKTLAELKNQIVKLQEMVGQKDTSELDEIKAVQKDARFAFYDELSSKKAPVVSPRKEPAKKNPEQKNAVADNVEETGPPSPNSGLYVVQVASLDQEKQALNMVNRLLKKGYPAYHYKTFIKGRSYYRVRCGTFKSRSEAVDNQRKLAENERLKGFVQKVKRQ